jgi:phage shock protein PspC (stress-responsive transcriptional regulator)
MLVSDRLFRSRDDRMLAGVAGGLAELWDVDPSIVRIVWALLAIFTGGIALVVYIVMAIVVPEEDAVWPVGASGTASPAEGAPGQRPSGAAAAAGVGATATDAATPRTGSPPADPRPSRAEARAARRAARHERADGSNPALTIIALALIGGGAFFLIRQWLPAIDLAWFWPVMLILAGVVLLVAAFGRRPGGDDPGAGGTR